MVADSDDGRTDWRPRSKGYLGRVGRRHWQPGTRDGHDQAKASNRRQRVRRARASIRDGGDVGRFQVTAADFLEGRAWIQREGDDRLGAGNFRALFESLERNQISSGVLEV